MNDNPSPIDRTIYYVMKSKIPRKLFHENMISSHGKSSVLLWLHNNLAFCSKKNHCWKVKLINENYIKVSFLFAAYQLSLLIWSPNPGVSVIVNFNRTPFSSITENQSKTKQQQNNNNNNNVCQKELQHCLIQTSQTSQSWPKYINFIHNVSSTEQGLTTLKIYREC